MKAYTRELKEKATRDSQFLTGPATFEELLTACGLERPDAGHLRAVWSARMCLATTKAQRRICETMLQKIEQGV